METFDSQWIILIVEGAGILLAIGITWGLLRSKVEYLTNEVTGLKKTIDALNIKLEGHDNEFHTYIQEHSEVTRSYEGRISFLEARTNGRPKS